jgi:NAD(P)-dependent dehydrogenase (short-subunit alcohol dehydrogenase family)
VTGANRGIGATLVRELAARGAARVYAAVQPHNVDDSVMAAALTEFFS